MFHDEIFVLTHRTRTAAAPCILFIQPKYFEKAEEFGGGGGEGSLPSFLIFPSRYEPFLYVVFFFILFFYLDIAFYFVYHVVLLS